MPIIGIERDGPRIWPWIIGLAVLALVVRAVDELLDTRVERIAGVETVEATEAAESAGAAPPTATSRPAGAGPESVIGSILGAPAAWLDRRFPDSEVRVADVPTGSGFWIEDQGQRLFVVVVDRSEEKPKVVEPGQMVRIRTGMLRDRTSLPDLPDGPIDGETRAIAEQQQVFLVVDEDRIHVLYGATP